MDPVGRATVANYGLMDQLAALHWVQENIVRFSGDPGHVTVMGHGTGAACLNFLVISPAATGESAHLASASVPQSRCFLCKLPDLCHFGLFISIPVACNKAGSRAGQRWGEK